MRFEMIGVQFDQAGHDEIAACVLAAYGRVSLAELGNAAVGAGDPATFDHPVRQHDPGVANHGIGCGRAHLI